jgi:glycosyltransferase involved in cell wall biosynthesis
MHKTFDIIICTYKRAESVKLLLNALIDQTIVATKIIVVDSSEDDDTAKSISLVDKKLAIEYIKVNQHEKGLTKQRNIGLKAVSEQSEIVFFLDDDIIPENDFCEKICSVFADETVIGCDGLIVNECYWIPKSAVNKLPKYYQEIDGYYLPIIGRDKLRLLLNLYPLHFQPGLIPPYGHGKSSLPPTGKTYQVDHIMGGITAYRKTIFEHIHFSEFFEGYGLYEDFDFSVRASEYGKLVTHTGAHINHYHASGGRPNRFTYGKMVVRNGWYVWRLKYPNASFSNILKWHCITLLLAFIRLANTASLSPQQSYGAFTDFLGRITAWFFLWVQKAVVRYE